jgi:hypothetical protein
VVNIDFNDLEHVIQVRVHLEHVVTDKFMVCPLGLRGDSPAPGETI